MDNILDRDINVRCLEYENSCFIKECPFLRRHKLKGEVS